MIGKNLGKKDEFSQIDLGKKGKLFDFLYFVDSPGYDLYWFKSTYIAVSPFRVS